MALHKPRHPVRFITAAALFDGHDAAINLVRRLLQAQGAEVVHLGHDRSVEEVVTAAIEEDVQGVAVSSYQGGHLEYFGYLADSLAERGADHIRVYGGGGGVIVATEIEELARHGVTIFSPADGQRLGLQAMVNQLLVDCDRVPRQPPEPEAVRRGNAAALAQALSILQAGDPRLAAQLADGGVPAVPVLGVTGTGGSGKSSLTDELLLRFRRDSGDALRIAVLAIDPSRRRGGGALLGDRIRMNALGPQVYFRSLATRGGAGGLPDHLDQLLLACKVAGFDLIIVETPGMGQGDSAIADQVDTLLYVMTPEFGAATQLEKIAALEVADVVAINKYDRRGAQDARRDVARQLLRHREAFGTPWAEMPVFGTVASRFNDDGVTALYHRLKRLLVGHGLAAAAATLPVPPGMVSTPTRAIVPPGRERYLSEVATAVRAYRAHTADQVAAVQRRAHLEAAIALLSQAAPDTVQEWRHLAAEGVEPDTDALLAEHAHRIATAQPRATTLSGSLVPMVALPHHLEAGALVRYLREENVPGVFPFTAGVFREKRHGERPTRMFAGEGDPARTNRRFHLLAHGQPTTRLSTAFDSVTLYGRDPAGRPDIYGKVGTSGVSVATIDDMRDLFAGFDLADPATSVSMTINGPAPSILAMFLNAAIDQADDPEVVRTVRGTVQADILKEDQGQNTCLFSVDFSLRAMADVQAWFVRHEVQNFYSVSISGYHIAEAGANPLTQLALTLANGFTYLEAFLARGLALDDVARNLSFFFSNGMDAEYTVIGRVARRIWAIALRDKYGAGERAQKLKYHVQTSGRSLHASEMDFNDIRTTLQALCALYDNANSLHTNAYDEAVTTPSEHSVRRALAIQLIIEAEWGLSACANPLQGSYLLEELTDLVEDAVLAEFDALSERGGVLGAMETGYQRGKIQDESMLYETRKHDGSLPLIGVNTFVDPSAEATRVTPLSRGTQAEKDSQLARLAAFHARNADLSGPALRRLQEVAATGENLFEELMSTVRVCSLGQITEALFEVGGRYRRTV
ncbi:MAG: fused isobutyryl-CoA mutase/GTPase IcmF [Micropruina sp.]|nr:cobalamin-dependent protein [Micropruina sp.]